jgi:hypothetical protein
LHKLERKIKRLKKKAKAETVTNGVYTTGNQTIAGVKTFSSSPIVPTPTTGTQVANKDYVDSKAIGIGVGQTWQNVKSTRLSGVTYTNTTGRSIFFKVSGGLTSDGSAVLALSVDGSEIERSQTPNLTIGSTAFVSVSAVIPTGSTYSYVATDITEASRLVWELR